MTTIKEQIQNMSAEELVDYIFDFNSRCHACINFIDRDNCDLSHCKEGIKEYLDSTDKDIFKKKILRAIKRIYNSFPTGGALHIVLDDGNLGDSHILWCLENTIPKIDEKLTRRLFESCANALLELSLEEREELINN